MFFPHCIEDRDGAIKINLNLNLTLFCVAQFKFSFLHVENLFSSGWKGAKREKGEREIPLWHIIINYTWKAS
jgi:hypothetical protein